MKSKTKKVKIKVPRAPKMPKRSVMEDFAAIMQEVFAVGEAPAVKKVTEKNGLYTAYNERGQPVAYFGRAFARALNEFIPLIAPSNVLSAGHESVRSAIETQGISSGKLAPETHSAPRKVIRLYVVARDQAVYETFIRNHQREYPCRQFIFNRVSQPEHLCGLNFQEDTRLILLFGWYHEASEEFRQAVRRAKERQREAQWSRRHG